MLIGAGMTAGVPVGRRIAAQRGAARLARPEVHPPIARFHAFFTDPLRRVLDLGDGLDVLARF